MRAHFSEALSERGEDAHLRPARIEERTAVKKRSARVVRDSIDEVKIHKIDSTDRKSVV